MSHQSRQRMRSRLRACRFKVKLDLTNAPEYLLKAQKDTTRYHKPEDLEIYQCPCGWLHIGHRREPR